jgi:molybdopterin-containing oxidoreductase family iron-sulfur binding subunit
MTHPLEEWGDLRAQDGTVSIIQPLIAPLFEGRSAIEFVSALNGQPVSGYDVLRSTWQTAGLPGVGDFEVRWRDFVHDGVLRGSAFAPINAKFNPVQPPISSGNGIEINFRPDPTIFDGRYANNGWLQELPKTVTKLTWDNAAIMSPSTAKELGVTHEDMIEITVGDVKAKVGVFLQPGVAKNSITLYFGYGRTVGGAIATAKQNGGEYDAKEGGGVNVFPIRMTTGMNSVIVSKESIKKVDGRTQLISTQGHNPLPTDRITDERDILRETTLAQFVRDPEELEPSYAFPKEEIAPNNLYVEEVFEWNGEQWGMTIDLNTCTGCNACVTACQAENNIPVVGKQQVANGREMHWIRIDRYYSGSDDNPQMTWQPLMCVHCEKAPCEPVCPVAATVHSHDGLNQMIYNRCVGTRYCSNNCPYKVRRFNYLNYTDNQPNFMTKVRPISALLGNTTEERQNGIQLLKMINNPNVTVRGRGIMEKCTYCVQRINNARIESKKTGKDIKDGEIVTACEQACPTSSITFGNIRDKASRVAKLRNDPRAWLLLEEYQTRPRTSHLAKLRNPNPVIEPVPAPKPKRQKHGEEHGEEHGAESHGSEHESTENHTHDESTHSETSPQTQEAGGAH